ncbi:MAG: rod shape-determining protein MreD [Anaerolineae bacterium]
MVLPLLTVAALAQSTALAGISLFGARPDLVFLLVAVWAFLRGPIEGAVWAFIGGLLLDTLSGGPFGGFTLALLAAALLVGQQWGRELGSTAFQLAVLVLVAGFVAHGILLLAMSATGYPVNWPYVLAHITGPSAVLNALLAPVVHLPLSWIDRRTRPEGITF